MLTATELQTLAAKMREALPLIERLAEMDLASAEQNVARLNAEGPRLIEHYKTQARTEAREEMSNEREVHNRKLASERSDHEAKMTEERSTAMQDRAEAARILAELRMKTEQRLAAAHRAAMDAIG